MEDILQNSERLSETMVFTPVDLTPDVILAMFDVRYSTTNNIRRRLEESVMDVLTLFLQDLKGMYLHVFDFVVIFISWMNYLA